MDSAGIRLLLLTRSEVHAAGRSWTITATSPVAYDLLSVTGLVERGVTRLARGVKTAHGFGVTAFADSECVVLPGFARAAGFRF